MKFLKLLWSKDIFKVSMWSGVNTLIKLVTGFVLGKVLAIVVGPPGVAMIGQLTNFTSIFNTLSTGAVHTGVTKFVAEYNDDENERLKVIKAGFFTTLVGSLICSVVLFIGAGIFNKFLFNGLNYTYIIYVYALTIFFYGLNTLLLSILNGYKEFKLFIRLNAVISVTGVFISLALVLFSKLSGALLAVVLSQTVSCFITFLVIRKKEWFKLSYFTTIPDKGTIGKLMIFALMTSISAFVLPFCQIFTRSLIISSASVNVAGLWDALTRISGLLQLFLVTSLTTYYMPRLSEIREIKELRNEVFKTVKLVAPILILVLLGIYLFKNLIVLTLYTHEFLGITALFKIQLIGDLFKLTSWLFAFVTLARGNAKYFLILELGYFCYYMILCYFLIPVYGLDGAVWAYCISYIINFMVSVGLFLRYCQFESVKSIKN